MTDELMGVSESDMADYAGQEADAQAQYEANQSAKGEIEAEIENQMDATNGGFCMKGLLCGILEDKSIGNCSAGGISESVTDVVLLTDLKEARVFEPKNSTPAVVLKRMGDYVWAEPVEPCPKGMIGYCVGGTFIYTCDSRYEKITGVRYPIPLHDRCDTPENYEALTQ